jgi:hypothetical protein
MKMRTLSIWLTSVGLLASLPFSLLSYYSSRASGRLDTVIEQNGLHSVSAETIRAWIQAQSELWGANFIFALLSATALALNLLVLTRKSPLKPR